jgi:hypothetical protein
MTAQSTRWLAFLLVAAVLAGGCDGVIDPSENTVEDFPGTIQPLGLVSHPFTVSKTGEFEIRITALSNPDAILFMAYGLDTGGCNGSNSMGSAYRTLNQIGFGTIIQPGRYCAYLQDELGVLRAPATYNLRVSHP